MSANPSIPSLKKYLVRLVSCGNRKEVYIAFGVPPSYADPQSSYSIGSASDRFRLIEDTCMPLGAKIADAMEVVSKAFLGTGATIFVEFEWDSHSTMQAVRSERFETAIKGVEKGIPWKIASSYFDLGLPRFAGDEVGRIPFNLQEIDGPAPGATDTTPVDDQGTESLEDLEKLFARRQQKTRKPAAKSKAALKKRSTDAWRRVHRQREPWEKKFKSKISRYLMDARAETLRKLAALSEEEKSILAALGEEERSIDANSMDGRHKTRITKPKKS